MSSVVVVLCVLFALAVLPASTVLGVLATAAGSLFEGTPFILAGLALRALLARVPHVPPGLARAAGAYLGCGCAAGAAARSLPAAAATVLAFGAWVALVRLCGAMLVTRILPHRDEPAATLLDQLADFAPAAVIGAVALDAFGEIRFERFPALAQLVGGGLAGVALAPCALGAVAVAVSLRVRAPLAALGFLCTAGIVDLRWLRRPRCAHRSHDALAYAAAALALALVALRGGAALVHPRFSVALGLCALACAVAAFVHRRASSPRARLAPAIMLAGALLGAPAPPYAATETTLGDLFPGEHVTFAGRLVRGRDADALVRFAITCCRADASPVVLRLAQRAREPSNAWLRAEGTIEHVGDELRLRVRRVQEIAPPSDPFIYL